MHGLRISLAKDNLQQEFKVITLLRKHNKRLWSSKHGLGMENRNTDPLSVLIPALSFISNSHKVRAGIGQGCFLAPFLFFIAFELVMKITKN